MKMVVSSQMSDKNEHNNLLRETVKNLPNRKLDRETGVRLMTIGSENDDIPFLGMVEALGSTVVIEEHCTGSRYFWDEVIPEEDRLSAIAARYVNRVPCPSKDWEDRLRIPFILQLAKDYSAQGALLIQQKFCDPHELDIPAIKAALESNGDILRGLVASLSGLYIPIASLVCGRTRRMGVWDLKRPPSSGVFKLKIETRHCES